MNPFYTVVALDGGRVGVDDLMPALTALERADQNGQLAVVEQWGAAWVPATERGRPAVLHKHGILAVGDVRLTNRGLLAAGRDRAAAADLALVVDRYRAGGFAGLAELVGDFAFVLWDAENHRLVAARDGVGIRDLYFRRLRGRLAVASHLDAFEDCELDAAYLAEFAAGFPPVDGRTPYQGVERVHPGGYLLVEDGRLTHGRYWRAEDYRAGQIRVGEREAVAEFGRLFEEAVAAQTDDGLVTWAQLSGGLDSSSVVGMVETRAARGLGPRLAGTQTVVDGLGDGDETRYSDAVVARYSLRNEKIADTWPWQADLLGPPRAASPRAFLPFYARDRALRNVVVHNGGQVLLSGFGSDQYLAGSFDYIADLAARGEYGAAARHTIDLAVATRQSVWATGRRHLLAPLFPRWFGRAGTGPAAPSWITPGLVDTERCGRLVAGRDHGVFDTDQARELHVVGSQLERGLFEDGLEMRYPYLHRPLVEFALQLPVEQRFRPLCPKWILREAAGHVLPDVIRRRQGKGGIDGRVLWALSRERPLLDAMLAESHLADLGLVRRETLAGQLEQARQGVGQALVALMHTLALETWLAVRSGWWARRGAALQTSPQYTYAKESRYEVPIR